MPKIIVEFLFLGVCSAFWAEVGKNGRLEAFTQTISGFEIARLDLRFRKSGDIVDGTVQSGVQFKWLALADDENIVQIAKDRLRAL